MENKSRAINYSVSCIPDQYVHVASFVINRVVRDIKEAAITLKLKSVYPVGGSTNLDIILLVAVDPEAVIELNDKDVVDVIEECLADSLSFISPCENVNVFVNTSAELAFVTSLLLMVL